MDREQEEMQLLGLFGIYAESYKLIFRWRKIFSQITLALILPLSLVFLTHEEMPAMPQNSVFWHAEYNTLSAFVSSEWSVYVLSEVVYFTFLLVFSLLSTSAVVYTVASVYTSREITLKNVMSVVPRVWKRLMITFLCTFLGFLAYNALFVAILILWFEAVSYVNVPYAPVILWIVLALYPIGFVYMTIIWQLASTVTVLEDSTGVVAMIKSKNLIKGTRVVALVIFFKLNFSLVIIDGYFRDKCLVPLGTGWGFTKRWAGSSVFVGPVEGDSVCAGCPNGDLLRMQVVSP